MVGQRKPDQRGAGRSAQLLDGQDAGEIREQITDRHADQDAEQFQIAPGPDVETDHDRQGGETDDYRRRAVCAVLEPEEVDAGDPDDRDADHGDDNAGNFRGEEDPQAVQDPGKGGFDETCSHGHAEDQGEPAGLHAE